MKLLVGLALIFFAPLGMAQVQPTPKDVRVLGMVIRFSDTTAPTSPANLNAVLFTRADSVAAFWRENSYGIMQMAGTVYPTVLVSKNTRASGNCYGSMIAEAKALVKEAGVDLSQYQKFVVVHSAGVCKGKGMGGGSDVAMNGSVSPVYIAHELGHAFGLPHAASIVCPVATGTAGPCARNEYGNPFDVMAGERYAQSGAPHKWELGYLENRVYLHPGGKASYTIRPVEASNGVVAVKVGAPSCSSRSSLAGNCLWIEYRQPLGYFDPRAASPKTAALIFGGAMISYTGVIDVGRARTLPCGPCLVHVHNGVGADHMARTYGFTLMAGETYTDKKVNTRITVDALTPEAMTVTVESL